MGVTQSSGPISLNGGSHALSGGQVNDNADQQMSAPGSWGVAPEPGDPTFTQHQVPAFGTGADVSEELANPSGSKAPGVIRGPDGRWAQAVAEMPQDMTDTPNSGLWGPTSSSRI